MPCLAPDSRGPLALWPSGHLDLKGKIHPMKPACHHSHLPVARSRVSMALNTSAESISIRRASPWPMLHFP
jgi:hypothetical protein